MVPLMQVTVSHRDWEGPRKVEMSEGSTVQGLLDGLGFRAHAVLVLQAGQPVPENAPAEDGAEYEVITVASGG
jgi:sulfur carrier protein ThiS